MFITKFKNMKKDAMADKLRPKFLMFKLNRIHTSTLKTEKHSIKSQEYSTKSDKNLMKRTGFDFSTIKCETKSLKR
jgi:hypothetical protein